MTAGEWNPWFVTAAAPAIVAWLPDGAAFVAMFFLVSEGVPALSPLSSVLCSSGAARLERDLQRASVIPVPATSHAQAAMHVSIENSFQRGEHV